MSRKIVAAICWGLLAAILVFDVANLSLAISYPSALFALGFLCGHLAWPQVKRVATKIEIPE